MFKYIKYTPMTDDHTTHIFNEINDKCKVHRFDVPYVSVEYTDKADFAALVATQLPAIEAVEITKVEFADIVQYSDQIKRIYSVANEQFASDMKAISEKYTQEERDTWSIQVEEANAVKAGVTISTPFLSSLAADESITLMEAADKVLSIKSEYALFSSQCLARKWVKVSELKSEVGV